MLRISTRMMYNQSVDYINNKLTTLTELNEESSSQKRVNKPSDDPTGSATILNLRTTLGSYDQYLENISTAKGWLSTSDSTLSQVSTLISTIKGLAQEAATDSETAINRQQIASQVRESYEQLIALANTEYQDQSIYGGQNTDADPFSECLWMTTNNAQLYASNSFTINGDTDYTVLAEFTKDGLTSGATAQMSACGLRYSTDGGKTFKDGTVSVDSSGHIVLTLPDSGVSVTFDHDCSVPVNGSTSDLTTGTWMWIRPSAVYNGDDSDMTSTTVAATGAGSKLISASASGSFGGNTTVRIDNASAVTMGGEIEYSYSFDGGINWVTGNTMAADATSNGTTLNIANAGLLTLASNGSNLLEPGMQFVITPDTGGVSLQVSSSEFVRINDVGKDIFGGIYQDPQAVLSRGGSRLTISSSNASTMFSDSTGVYNSNGGTVTKNLFETVGNLLGYLETNNQAGIAQCIESLKLSQTQITTAVASVGGRENRLSTSKTILTNLKDSVNTQLSSVEDVDITRLLTQLSQQEIAYQAVLKSSSMIMQMSLMNYL